MRPMILSAILLAAASVSHAQGRARSALPRPGDRVILRGADRGPGRPPAVNATVEWDDFMAFYEAIARHDWDRTFELRQDGLLLELSGGASAVVLDLGAPEEPDELPDPMPDAVQLRILDWPRPDEVYWVPLHALSSTIGVAARAMAETKSGKRINPAARDSAVSARPGSPELLSCVTLLRLGAKQTPPARADCINIRSGPGNLSRSLMDDERQVAEMIRALKRSGWSIGDVAYDSPSGRVWIVSGTNGENRFVAEGATERAAWEGACEQARPLGMLRTSAGR